MIDITSFLLKHLYELMADNYNVAAQRANERALRQQQEAPRHQSEPARSRREEARNGGASDTRRSDTTASGGHCCGKPGQARRRQQQRAQHNQQATRDPQQGGGGGPLALLKRSLSHCCRQRQQQPGQDEQRGREQQERPDELQTSRRLRLRLLAREQETNQQIVAFLINNQLPDLACETLIELIFIAVFLAISWIFVMIVQLHCQQAAGVGGIEAQQQQQLAGHYQSARHFYCNTKFLNSLMYCNHHESKLLAA